DEVAAGGGVRVEDFEGLLLVGSPAEDVAAQTEREDVEVAAADDRHWRDATTELRNAVRAGAGAGRARWRRRVLRARLAAAHPRRAPRVVVEGPGPIRRD